MAESPDTLLDTYLSDQWRIHGGPRKKSAREELRDRLIPVVIKAFSSVESSLDFLLKESPCSNGYRINTLIRAYKLYFLRMQRKAVEAGDQAAEQRFADLQGQFNELEEYEKNLIGSAEPQDNERIHATLRTSVCNLPKPRPAASTVLDVFQEDASARPLGDNPFPPDHPAYRAFEEATWEAKKTINRLKSELLQADPTAQADPIQSILTFRMRLFSACANAALLIVGNKETALGYEHWIDAFAGFMLQETLRKGQLPDPQADSGTPPLFRPEILPRIERDLTLELMRVVAYYKEQAAARLLQIMQERATAVTRASDGEEMVPAANTTSKRRGRHPNPERRDAIRNAISKHGEQWRDHLNEIFTELDSLEASLGDFQGVKIDLGDGQSRKVSSWDDLDLAQGEQRRQIVDTLRKYAD